MKWKEDRKEMKDCIKELKNRVKEIEKTTGELKRLDFKDGKRKGRRIMEDRLTEIERKIKMRETKKRKKNIIIIRVGVREGKRRKAVEKVLKVIRVKIEMEDIRKLEEKKGKGGEMLVKLKDEVHKREIMRTKKKLKKRKNKVLENLT